jgi:hypothetical protein
LHTFKIRHADRIIVKYVPLKRKLPAGFVKPAQPVEATRLPAGPQWVHEIKHDGYRLMVHRQGALLRLWTRRAVDYTDRFPAIAAAASRLTANSFTIDGEATVIGPDGLAQFDELRRRESARAAILYAFDLLEHGSEDLRARSRRGTPCEVDACHIRSIIAEIEMRVRRGRRWATTKESLCSQILGSERALTLGHSASKHQLSSGCVS